MGQRIRAIMQGRSRRRWQFGLLLGTVALLVGLGCSPSSLFSRATPVAPNGGMATNQVDPAQSWAFTPEPDTFSPEALLDLRDLNEPVAGETGFIRRSEDGKDFVTGDGSPLRFWATNTYVWSGHPEALADHARFLAKRGVNLVRWHGQIPAQGEGTALGEIDETARDQLWQMVAAMKAEGIYTVISPYFAAYLPIQPQWPVPRDSDNMSGLLFFDPVVQAAYKEWWRALLEPVNPYTGVALKDDPAIALLQLQNEDSLLFWTLDRLQGEDLVLLLGQYGDWLRAKYGSLDQALQAWGGATLDGDDLGAGQPQLYPLWELTQPATEPGKGQRLADQTEFLTTTMADFNGAMVQFLRQELGVQALINANNWRTADPARLNDAERYTYTRAEVMAVNRYYNGIHSGEHSGWAIVDGDRFTDPSALFHPDQLPTNLKQVADHPMLITESSWVPPLSYQSEGPFLVSLFQSLTGVDGFFWFAMGEPQWRQPQSANGYLPSLGKWTTDTPELLGNFPAAALMYRRGYIQQGEPVVQEHRSLDDLWQRQLPLLAESASFDPNRDAGSGATATEQSEAVHPLAYLVGPVEVTYDSDPALNQVADITSQIDETAKTVTAITDEITWDYGRGLCVLNAPKAQGVTGFLQQAGPLSFGDISLTADNHYGTVLAVAMDDQPLASSSQVLVQVGTTARPTGWGQTPRQWSDEAGTTRQGYEVTDYGTAPWRVANTQVTLTLGIPGIRQAQVLDMNGLVQGTVPVQPQGDGVVVTLPPAAKYVVLSP